MIKLPDDFMQSIEAVANINNDLYRWTSRMSYNSSWVGEPEGLIKGHIREMEKILDSMRAEVQRLNATVQPVSDDRNKVRAEHAEWSQATFGNVGPIGPLKHLSKEALEAAAEPGDLSEWADMQFLIWDAQRRAGINDEQITQAMIEKLAVNKAREWPEPKDGEPRLHIKAAAPGGQDD